MVGRPGFPEDIDKRPYLRGAGITTPGLGALDEEREASMADEGGWSGAVMESEKFDIPFACRRGPLIPEAANPSLSARLPPKAASGGKPAPSPRPYWMIGALALGTVGLSLGGLLLLRAWRRAC